MLDMTCADYTTATQHFATADKIERNIKSAPLLARTHTWWATCLLRRGSAGDDSHARRLLHHAHKTAETLGIRDLLDKTQRLLASSQPTA
jgi:hypothetical protein